MQEKNSQKLESQLRQKEKELYSIQKIGQALSNTLKLDDLLNLIMKEITKLMDADRSTLYLVDRQKQEIWSKIALKAEVKEIRQKIGVGISGYVAATGETINIPDAYKDKRFDPSTDKRTGYRTRSILCLPVWEPLGGEEKRQILGVIQVLNKKSGVFNEGDEGILKAIGSEVAIAISNARLYQQLENKYGEIDLLYEFEQMLSAQFKVFEVFCNMFKHTVQHLKGKLAGAVYPLDGKYHFLILDNQGKIFHQTLARLDANILAVLQGKQNIREPAVKRILVGYLPILTDEDFDYLKFIPISIGESKSDKAALLFQDFSPAAENIETDDLQLLEIVGQKISRALELYALRETLLRQERLSAVGQMMSTIVHDLRSPINSIYGFMELLLEEGVSSDERKEFADIIRLEIQSVTNMTTEILDFAKGKTSILPRKCSVREIIKRFQPQAEQLFRKTGIDFKIQNNSKLIIYADIEKFTRILYNIAKNAKEAMGGKGKFVVKVNDLDKEVVFEMEDNGPGIPEEIKNRLFESFVTSGKKSGTGLGLAIVKKIVDDHQGEIEIKSESSKGTTFYIKLPEYQIGGVSKA